MAGVVDQRMQNTFLLTCAVLVLGMAHELGLYRLFLEAGTHFVLSFVFLLVMGCVGWGVYTLLQIFKEGKAVDSER